MRFKPHAEFDAQKRVFVKCPKCGRQQELPICDEWYSVDVKGKVHPEFVCIEESRKCFFQGLVWIVNWP